MEGWQKTLSPKTQKPLRPEVNWNTTCKVFYQDWLLIINLIKNEKEKRQSDSKERRKRCKHNTSKFEVTKWKNIYNDEIFDCFFPLVFTCMSVFFRCSLVLSSIFICFPYWSSMFYRIPKLPCEIVSYTLSFFTTTFLQTAIKGC